MLNFSLNCTFAKKNNAQNLNKTNSFLLRQNFPRLLIFSLITFLSEMKLFREVILRKLSEMPDGVVILI